MKKLIIIVIALFYLTACDIKTPDDNISQIKPTQSAENKQPQVIPTEPAVNNKTSGDTKSEEGITTPILINNLLMGGLSAGTWMQPDEFYNSGCVNFDGFEYDTYLNNKNNGKAKGIQPANWMTGELLQGNQYEDEYSIVDLYDNNRQLISYDIALDADWELFPRPYTEQSTNQSEYLDVITSYLKDYGVKNPQTAIKQLIKVDLEGDGTEEMLIAADNTSEEQFDEVKSGDNAVLIFRKVVGEEVIDQIVEQDIRLKDEDSWYRFLFRVETIADLDGDHMMEVVIKSWYYEGIGWSIYKLRDNQLEFIVANGYGA